jgi:transcriptional regulatory protein RtcR
LAKGGRVSETLVGEEIQRLRETWRPKPASESAAELDNVLGTEAAAKLDRFERVQLADVIAVCRQANTISEAGRTLFANSRQKRSQTNDADRLRKYLNRFGLSWRDIHPQTHANAE